MPLARFIMVLLLSCLCVQGAVYRITGVKLGSGGKWHFEGGSTINGRSVGGQFASYAQVRAFSRLSTNRRYAVPAAVPAAVRRKPAHRSAPPVNLPPLMHHGCKDWNTYPFRLFSSLPQHHLHQSR